MKKKTTVLLEFGIPLYRDFLFKYLDSISDEFLIIHNGEFFKKQRYSYKTCIPYVIKIWKFKFYFKVMKSVRKSDVIIGSFNFWRPSCWLPMFFTRKKFVLWGHIKGGHENLISRYFKIKCMNRAHYVLSYTERGKNYAVNELGLNRNKILVVRNTILVSNSELSIKERNYFLYVGRIQKRKGLDIFIRNLTNIDHQNELLRIVGDGDYKDELINLVRSLNLEQKVIFFEGTFDEIELKGHFHQAIAYVSPQQVGLGVVHAFAYGIPVLLDDSLKHGPEFEYCNKENSYFYSGEEQLSNKIKIILSDKKDSLIKGENAFNFFKSNLKIENMQNAFCKAIYE